MILQMTYRNTNVFRIHKHVDKFIIEFILSYSIENMYEYIDFKQRIVLVL